MYLEQESPCDRGITMWSGRGVSLSIWHWVRGPDMVAHTSISNREVGEGAEDVDTDEDMDDDTPVLALGEGEYKIQWRFPVVDKGGNIGKCM